MLLSFGLGRRLWHVLPLTGAVLCLLFSLPRWRALRAAVAVPVSERAR
ncbi:hypothetical protein ACFY20_18955 [Streptomyces sp. NPDC001312]